MACTRNKNMSGNYCLEQNTMKHALDYELYKHSQYGVPTSTAIPLVGITPSHMSRNAFSKNPIEVESELFGIGTCNLVSPKPPVKPELVSVPEVSFFNRVPMIYPKEFKADTTQRPFPVPN